MPRFIIINFIHFFLLLFQLHAGETTTGALDPQQFDKQLFEAIKNGRQDTVRYLIEEKKANPNAEISNWTPLKAAAYFGHLDIVKYLVHQPRVHLNAIDSLAYTPFMHAVTENRFDVVKFFVEREGFNPHIEGVVGMSLAHRKSHKAIIDYLIKKGIPAIPEAEDLSSSKSIFYNKKANAKITPTRFEILAYDTKIIPPTTGIHALSQGGKMHVYQPKVFKQGGTKEPCFNEQLIEAVKRLGGTQEMHCAANPIFGGTCAYHAVKNALMGLVMLYDYDALVQCIDRNEKSCEHAAHWVSGDMKNLVKLKTENFDGEQFLERLHAKTFMIHTSAISGKPKSIDIQQAFSVERMHLARQDIEDELASLMTNRHKVPVGKYDNSFSFVDATAIAAVQHEWSIESLIDCDTLYEKNNSLSDLIKGIQASDLLQQIVLFRKNSKYRHAFILSLNEGTIDGYGISSGESNRMHAITVIVDKSDSIVNAIICESNNLTTYAIKQILLDFLDLFIDDNKVTLNADQISVLHLFATSTLGHSIKEQQKGLPSAQSLIEAYEHALKEYHSKRNRKDIHQAFFLLSRIERLHRRAEGRTLIALKKLLPERLLKKGGFRKEEIELHKIIQNIEVKELNEKLFDFITMGELENVKEMVKIGADLHAKDDQGETPLTRAAMSGNVAIIEYLLSQHISVDDVNTKGKTALMAAAQCGKVEIVKHLIEHAANVNKRDNEGSVALMYAATAFYHPRLDLIKCLVEEGKADSKIINTAGQNALIMSACVGDVDAVTYFVNRCGMTVNLATLIDYITQERMLPGDHSSLSFILSVAVVDYLIKQQGLTAAQNQQLCIKVLMAAAKNSKTDVIKRLIEPDCGVDINAQDENGWTALMYAEDAGYSDVVNVLINEYHADQTIKNNNGQTAADIAQAIMNPEN